MMKRRRFLQLAGTAAAGAAVRTSAFASLIHDREVFIAIGGKSLGAGEVIRVRTGERVRFQFVHAGGSEEVYLHLPGHRFTVIALDGHPVPTRAAVDVLSLAAGERIHAKVEMSRPGNWILGSVDDAERAGGRSVRVVYPDQDGSAQWHPPASLDWSYARFSGRNRDVPLPAQTIEMLLEKRPGSGDRSSHWIVDGQAGSDIEQLSFRTGRRYRVRMMNATDRAQPVQLPHHKFVLTRVNQVPVSGIIKDTVRLERYNVIEADLVTRSPGQNKPQISPLCSFGAPVEMTKGRL
jgi:FtsP/CotA-like multicopper oxidase with cupredoxin domain